MKKLTIGLAAAAVLCLMNPSAIQAQDMVPLKLELPKPSFMGTPGTFWFPHLDESFRKRGVIMVPEGTELLSKGKTVTSSAKKPDIGKLEMVVDGDRSWEEGHFVELEKGVQWVQIDLGAPKALTAALVWHYHAIERVYHDYIVKVADDAEFTQNVRTVYNSDHDNSANLGKGGDKCYVENYEGRYTDLKGEKAQFIRFYTNGNTDNESNHYVEIEIYGK